MGEAAAALAAATARLTANSATPRLDAEVLLAHALGIERAALLLDLPRLAVPDAFAALIDRRADGEPVAYITGYRDFWTLRLAVGPGVLIPRPDSETLIEAALDACADRAPTRILDLGCGPGTLLLAALSEWPDARGLGMDASDTALGYAARNATATGMARRATWMQGDWTVPGWLAALGGTFDLILSNPPYVEADAVLMRDVAGYEPGAALFAGADGLDAYRIIIPALPMLLVPGGVAVVEVGAGQAPAVIELARGTGLAAATRADLGGHDRAVILTRETAA